MESLSFLMHLLSNLDEIESLSGSMSEKGDGVGDEEPFLVHSLFSVSPVFN